MFTSFPTSLRRLSGYALPLLLASLGLSVSSAAQAPTVVSSSAMAVPHNETYGAPWQSAVSNRGDFVLFDFKTTGMYEYPANGGPEITLAAPSKIAGGFTDSGIAIDPRNNNIYLDNNYNGGLIEFPYDAATGEWDLPSVVVASGLSGNLGGSCGNYFQSAGLAMNANGVLAVATENGCGVEIFTVPVDASGNFGAATAIVSGMGARAKTITIDNVGNIAFNEDAGGLTGAYFIPAGTTGLTTDTGIAHLDPIVGGKPLLSGVQGVTVDAAGNFYIADSGAGVYLVPLQSGTPNTAGAYQVSTVPASGGPSIDARGILFYPTSGVGSIKDLVEIDLGRLELGSSPVGTASTVAGTVTYNFDAGATPDSILVQSAGNPADFILGALTSCGITITVDANGVQSKTTTPYAAGSACTIPVSFTPHVLGDATANLLMLDANGNVLSTTVLHGVGQGSAITVAPGTEAAIGSGLQTPTQVATDVAGNVYIADGGLGKVLQFAKGAGATTAPVSLGTGLTTPTGVAVDRAGDVFITDSGNVLEIPYGPTGLNTAGQFTLKSGFGTNLRIAVDAIGDVFVADPDNARVARLRTVAGNLLETDTNGLSGISAIAASGAGDLFLADSAGIVTYPLTGAQQTFTSSLTGINGLAVDPSGSLYVSSTNGSTRIPSQGGTLTATAGVPIGLSASKPTAIATDAVGNVYVTDAAAEDVDFVSPNGFINLGTLSTTTSTQSGTLTVLDSGNLALNVTGFGAAADFSVSGTTCTGAAVPVGGSCTATVLFNPGPGGQGPLAELLPTQSDAANAPVGINATGVAALLVASTTTSTVGTSTVNNTPVTATVASASGTGPVPTGTVTLTISSKTATPIVATQTLANGTVSFNLAQVPVGSYTFTVSYGGDRIYGRSSANTAVTVGQGAVVLVQPTASTVPTFVLAAGTGAQEPYDGSQASYYYNYPLVVKTVDGSPLVGVPILNPMGTQTGIDYGTVTYVVTGGTTPVCTGTAAIIKVNADGTAPFPTSCVNINNSNTQIPNILTSYSVTPVYAGATDPNYASVTGTAVSFTALRNPMVTISSNPTTLSVTSGSPATATLTLTSLLGYGVTGTLGNLNNYSLPVALDCAGLPAHATCSFSYPSPDPSDPNSVAVVPGKPGTVIMTVNTNVTAGTVTSSLHQASGATTFAAMFGIGLLGLLVGKKKSMRERLARALCLLVVSGSMLGISACNSAILGASPVLNTPSGTYQVTVTAKQVGSKTVPGSQPGTTVTVSGNGNLMSVPFTLNVAVH